MNIHQAIRDIQSGSVTPAMYRAWTSKPKCSDCLKELSLIAITNAGKSALECPQCGYSKDITQKHKGSVSQGAIQGRTPEVSIDERGEGINTHEI